MCSGLSGPSSCTHMRRAGEPIQKPLWVTVLCTVTPVASAWRPTMVRTWRVAVTVCPPMLSRAIVAGGDGEGRRVLTGVAGGRCLAGAGLADSIPEPTMTTVATAAVPAAADAPACAG